MINYVSELKALPAFIMKQTHCNMLLSSHVSFKSEVGCIATQVIYQGEVGVMVVETIWYGIKTQFP